MVKKTTTRIFILTIVTFLLQASVVFGATAASYELLTPIPSGDSASQSYTVSVDTTNPVGYVQSLFKIFIAIAIALTVIMLAYGGITYMTSDSIKLTSQGKDIISRALWGLLLLLCSYLILYTINPNTLNLSQLFQAGLGSSGGSSGTIGSTTAPSQ